MKRTWNAWPREGVGRSERSPGSRTPPHPLGVSRGLAARGLWEAGSCHQP